MIPEWIKDILTFSPLVAGVAAAAWIVVKVFPWARRVMHFIDDLVGEPERPGAEKRPGLMERVTAIEASLDQVRHEVTTNHGSSLKDSVKEVQAGVRDLAEWQTKHEKKSDALVERIDNIEKGSS